MVFRYCLGMTMSVSTLIIFKGAATPSNVVNLSISIKSLRETLARPCRAILYRPLFAGIARAGQGRVKAVSGSRLPLEAGLADDLANLHGMALVIDFLRLVLRNPVLRVHAPDALRLFRLEFDDGDALAVVGEKPFVRNVTGDGRRQFDHTIDERYVFLAHVRHQAGAENGDDHAGGLSGWRILRLSHRMRRPIKRMLSIGLMRPNDRGSEKAGACPHKLSLVNNG